jgi:hypothetical protein
MCRAVQDALVFSRWFQYCSEVLNDDWTGRRRFAEGCGVLVQQRGHLGRTRVVPRMIRGPRIIHGCPWGGPGVVLRGACLGCAQIGASWVWPTDHPRVEPWARPRSTQWVVHPRVVQGAPPALPTPGLAPGASLDHPTKAQPESEVWVVLGRPVVPSWVDPPGRDGTGTPLDHPTKAQPERSVVAPWVDPPGVERGGTGRDGTG